MCSATNSICDVPGIKVGHAQNEAGKTGCTVILPRDGAVGGIDIRGSAPGTREVETLKPVRLVPKINGLLLTGGSAFGLEASSGVQQFLEEAGIGYPIADTTVPIVPAAVIFDLREGDATIRPDKAMGREAATNASTARPAEGRVGAGRGATVGKLFGYEYRMKGGVGTCSTRFADVWVGALVVVNAFGNVVDPRTGRTIAGARDPKTGDFLDLETGLREQRIHTYGVPNNTTLGVVATNAELTKEQAIKVAQMAQDGLSRAIRPAHTPFDGDAVFCLSVGDRAVDLVALGDVAAHLLAEAIVRAVKIANRIERDGP